MTYTDLKLKLRVR